MRINCASDTVPRPRVSAVGLVPDRGPFIFPDPYNTRGVRVTNANDGPIEPVGYSYWRNINAHAGRPELLIFAGADRQLGGPGPQLFAVNKLTFEVLRLGPLFPADSPLSWCTGEGWYFSAVQPDILYVKMPTGTALQRLNVQTRELTTVFDLAEMPASGPGRYLWRCHSSQDDRVHSATLKQAETFADIGSLIVREGIDSFYFEQNHLRYDECQVDKSGRFLLIKDKLPGSSRSEVDNRIIAIGSGEEQDLLDVDGAGGHSDNGFGCMLAADNFHPLPRALRRWDFERSFRDPINGLVIYHGNSWEADDGHVSFCCARADLEIGRQRAVVSNASRVEAPRANEIVLVTTDGSLEANVLAPVLTDMDAPGGGIDYRKFPKANCDPYGEWVAWTSNLGGDRLDLLLLQVPL